VLLVEFIREVSKVGRALVSWPSHARARGIFLTVVAATAVACVEKFPIQHELGGDGRGPLEAVSQLVWRIGDGASVALLAVVLIFMGEALRLARVRRAGMQLAVAGVFCFALTKLGQFVFAEARPSEGGAMHFFAGHGHGFSGHASAAAVLFFPIYESARRDARARKTFVAAALIAWMILVGYTRVWTNQHFVWNVLAGWAVGLFTGHGAARYAPCSGA
jgi:membrane-associated phospholipid phosphatase